MNKGKVSIIISVLNGGSTIEYCIKSIIEQDYNDFELIIVDGGSKDNTVEILKKYSQYISFWTSENDTGIYNAWNKALSKTSGEWICFIGSDDAFLKSSISSLLKYAHYPEVNFVSSRVMMVDSGGKEFGAIGKSWNFKNLANGLGVVHCGALHHHTLFSEYGGFDEEYKIAGDFEFLLRVGKNIRPAFLDEVVIKMCNAGLSRRSVKKVIFETSKALFKHANFGKYAGLRYYLSAHLRSVVREVFFLFPFGKKLFSIRNKHKSA